MKHLEVRQNYSAGGRIFNSLLSVSSGDETLRLMLDIFRQRAVILGVDLSIKTTTRTTTTANFIENWKITNYNTFPPANSL